MSKAPAICDSRHDKLISEIERLEKVLANLNGHVIELRRAHGMLRQAIEELATESDVDVAVALAELTATRRR